eukprot:GABV01001455.1.p2 GENE.GABV01001455.1~~GABV01001455.1.p2  ORF type:complete len:180 (-),score=63.48 GABV01001455.1:28-567(-)
MPEAAPAVKVVEPKVEIWTGLQPMGFSENACKRAAVAVDNASVDAAMNWLLQHLEDADINDPLPAPGAPAGGSSGGPAINPEHVMLLQAMGFSEAHVKRALKETGGNPDRAADWLFSHPDDGSSGEETAAAEGGAADDAKAENKEPGAYELVGVISHMGTNVNMGHYVCHVRKEGNGTF